MREFSWLAILIGVVVGALLAAANAFVGLQVGMTISASIPAAVVALLILRSVLKSGSLLESNMVQTIGSAGESVAAGMIFTLPALFIMGQEVAYLSMVIWGAIGGMLGVCFMVPLRQVLIVREHGKLPYPEGVACAEVLESGERGGSGAKSVIWGAVIGSVYYLVTQLGCWTDTAKVSIHKLRTEFQLDSSPALLGVGYILGIRVAAYMLAGAVLSWFVLIPAIGFFGADVATPVFPSTAETIAQMTPKQIYNNYIRYIGAGAVAIGGLISLFKTLPTILSSFWHVLGGMFTRGDGRRDRTNRDFPFPLLVLLIAGIGYAMWQYPQAGLNQHGPIAVIAVLVCTFFFVTVSSRLVGLVGSSSNPVSGMTIATLLATALVYKFFFVDQADDPAGVDYTALRVTCLSVGAIVCIAISIAGDCSQDLKTGFLVKATPWKQQIGEMLGVLTSVVAIAGVLLLLNESYGFVKDADHPHPLLAPQANIMKILVEGVLGGTVPWELVLIGGAAAVIVELLGVTALPFAVGMYLPLGLSTPIMAGGIIRWSIDRKRKEKSEHDPGVLTAAGLVAGKGLMGVTLAGVTVLIAWLGSSPRWLNPFADDPTVSEPVSPAHLVPWLWTKIEMLPGHWGLVEECWKALSAAPFVLLVLWLWWCAKRRPRVTLPPAPTVPSAPPAPRPPDTPDELPSVPLSPASTSSMGSVGAEWPAEGRDVAPDDEPPAPAGDLAAPVPFAPSEPASDRPLVIDDVLKRGDTPSDTPNDGTPQPPEQDEGPLDVGDEDDGQDRTPPSDPTWP